jgi:hypothetical protein
VIPDRNRLKKEMQDKPVVLIAVNSGNPKSAVESYAKDVKLEWPILVDEAGETEKAYGFKISLQNIYQWVIIDPEGKIRPVGADDKRAEQAIKDLLPQAKMFFDGVAVPEKLKPLAREIELGNYDPAVGELAGLSQKGPKDLQEPAKAMFEKLKPLAEGGIERAKAAQGWAAYQEYERVAAWFKKTEYEKAATTAMAELKKDKAVKDEIAARQLLDQARTLLGSSKKAEQAQAQGLLQACAKKYPETEAGKEAARLAGK